MKRRYHRLLTLCAFLLLAFAFYLAFIKQEKPEITPEQIKAATAPPGTLTGEAQLPTAAIHK